jgi:hypothetical protein
MEELFDLGLKGKSLRIPIRHRRFISESLSVLARLGMAARFASGASGEAGFQAPRSRNRGSQQPNRDAGACNDGELGRPDGSCHEDFAAGQRECCEQANLQTQAPRLLPFEGCREDEVVEIIQPQQDDFHA